jgi:hypothetical protein
MLCASTGKSLVGMYVCTCVFFFLLFFSFFSFVRNAVNHCCAATIGG